MQLGLGGEGQSYCLSFDPGALLPGLAQPREPLQEAFRERQQARPLQTVLLDLVMNLNPLTHKESFLEALFLGSAVTREFV